MKKEYCKKLKPNRKETVDEFFERVYRRADGSYMVYNSKRNLMNPTGEIKPEIWDPETVSNYLRWLRSENLVL